MIGIPQATMIDRSITRYYRGLYDYHPNDYYYRSRYYDYPYTSSYLSRYYDRLRALDYDYDLDRSYYYGLLSPRRMARSVVATPVGSYII